MTGPVADPLEPQPADLAAEHALGVLDGPERAEAERRILLDPGFAAEVEEWRRRLARLADEAAPHPPPAGVWEAIARRLEAEGGGVAELKLRRAVTAWRTAAAVFAVAAAALAVAVAWPRPLPAPALPAPLQTASLTSTTGGAAAFTAVLDPARGELVITAAGAAATPGRSPQLWVLPAGGEPMSLGVAAFGRSVRLPAGAGVGAAARRTLAVSLEPLGGSPTGRPTGPVVATGELRTL